MGTSKLLYYACSPNFNFKTACPLCMREQASTSIGIHASLTATALPLPTPAGVLVLLATLDAAML